MIKLDIKPIETNYNGYRFRSRLEARWAVFFDTLGIKYEYEPEGYRLKNGTCYLPDFSLPDIGYYVEVKGKNNHLFEDITKIQEFVVEKKTAVIILSNIPYSEESLGLYWFPTCTYAARYCDQFDTYYAFFMSDYIQDYFALCREKYWNINLKSNDHIFDEIQCIHGKDFDYEDYTSIRQSFKELLLPVQEAILKARRARFEYGERG